MEGRAVATALTRRKSWADLLEEEEAGAQDSAQDSAPLPPGRAQHDLITAFFAARTLYNSIRAGKVSVDVAWHRAQHLEQVSPAASSALWTWLRSHSAEGDPQI